MRRSHHCHALFLSKRIGFTKSSRGLNTNLLLTSLSLVIIDLVSLRNNLFTLIDLILMYESSHDDPSFLPFVICMMKKSHSYKKKEMDSVLN